MPLTQDEKDNPVRTAVSLLDQLLLKHDPGPGEARDKAIEFIQSYDLDQKWKKLCDEFNRKQQFYIGQRVLVGDEIGIVQRGPSMVKGPPGQDTRPRDGYVWVHLPSKGYASDFSVDNVRPLPGGQV